MSKLNWVVKISDKDGYYSDEVRWGGVLDKKDATKMTHKDARHEADHLRQSGLNFPATIEEAE